ncbi:MAG: hypothetical protein ACKOA8_02790, partial [Deltaproteobacteria bacterium]
YETDYPNLWEKIFESEEKKTQSEISKIKETPLTPLNYLTSNRSYKGGLALSPDKTQLAYIAETSKEVSSIWVLDLKTKKKEKITSLYDSAFHDLCWLKEGDTEKLIYISASPKRGYAINELFEWNFKTQKSVAIGLETEKLTHVHRLNCSPETKTILVYTDKNEKGEIIELSAASEETPNKKPTLKVLRRWAVPERQWVTSVLSGSPAWIAVKEQLVTHLYRWDHEEPPKKIVTFPRELLNLKKQGEPHLLEAIADFNGRYEIWEIDLLKKNIQQKTHFLGGVNSFERKANEYLVNSYRHGGFDIALANSTPFSPIPFPKTDPPSPIPEKLTQVGEIKDYSPWATLRPHTWVPSLLFVPDGAQVGAWIPGFDLTQRHLFDIFGGYDTRGLPFGSLNYTHRFAKSSTLISGLNFSPSYLRISKSFFKRWGGKIGYGQDLPWGLPNANLSMVFSRLESSVFGPAEQSVGLEFAVSKAWGFAPRKQAISPIDGVKASLAHTQYFKTLGSNRNFFTSVASLAGYLEMPWRKNHVVYLAHKLGYTEGSSFINSFFEGGGELLFSQGRNFFLNRGFFPSLFAGRRMFSTNLEYRFPIQTIERGYLLLPAYLNSISGALVADTLTF